MKFLKHFLLLMIFVLVPQSMVFSSIISYKIEKIVPAQPLVGETFHIFIKIEEDKKLRSLQKQYRFQDTDSIEFGSIRRTIQNNDVFVQIELRAKHSGDIAIPSVSEDNYTFLLPLVSVKSTLQAQSNYVPVLLGLPLESILHMLFAMLVVLVALYMYGKPLIYGLSHIRSLQYKIRNMISYSASIRGVKRLIKILNDIGKEKTRILYSTRELYAKIDSLCRRRVSFYIGKTRAIAMTNTELAAFLLQELEVNSKILGKRIRALFLHINQVEYGMASCPLEIRKEHCQLVLTFFTLLREPQRESATTKTKAPVIST